MTKARAKKGSPLLLLVLLTIGAIAVGATLINLWTSQIVPKVHQVDTDFRGVDAQLIQAGLWGQYGLGQDATSLAIQSGISTNSYRSLSECAIFVIHSRDLPTENLEMTIDVFEADTSTSYAGWSCTPKFVRFYTDGDGGQIRQPSVILAAGKGPWTITNAQIADMIYGGQTGGQTGLTNALLLEFDFYGTDYIRIYSDTWVPTDDFSTFYDMTVSLAVETIG